MSKFPYQHYIFFEVHNDFYQLPRDDQKKLKTEFAAALANPKRLIVSSYSTLGYKAQSTFMLWCRCKTPSDIQVFLRDLLRTKIGRYLHISYTYFGIVRNSEYSGRGGKPEQDMQVQDDRLPYLVLYPFTKTTEWHMLDFENRKSIMGQHIKVGLTYPNTRQSLLYSYGVDDQEFIVSYEMKTLEEFQDLVMSMRRTVGRAYTLSDTPTYTCIYKTLEELVEWI